MDVNTLISRRRRTEREKARSRRDRALKIAKNNSRTLKKKPKRRKKDRKSVKSLWHTMAPAVWSPYPYNEEHVRSLIKAYSYKELKRMASEAGIDSHLSKKALAASIVADRNIFFPDEVGHYVHDTLVYFVHQLKVVHLSESELEDASNVELQKLLLTAWKGGSDEDMQLNLRHVVDLHDIVSGIETQFCSSKLKKILRSAPEDEISIYDHVQNSMTKVLDLYQHWSNTEDRKRKRELFSVVRQASEHAETVVMEYLKIIREYCTPEGSPSRPICDPDNVPTLLSTWMKTADLEDKMIMCNVTVKGRLVDFIEGEDLLPGLRVYRVVKTVTEDGEEVMWLGVAASSYENSSISKNDQRTQRNSFESFVDPRFPKEPPWNRPPGPGGPMPPFQNSPPHFKDGHHDFLDLFVSDGEATPQRVSNPVSQPVTINSSISEPSPGDTRIRRPEDSKPAAGTEFRTKLAALAKDTVLMGGKMFGRMALEAILFSGISQLGDQFPQTDYGDDPTTSIPPMVDPSGGESPNRPKNRPENTSLVSLPVVITPPGPPTLSTNTTQVLDPTPTPEIQEIQKIPQIDVCDLNQNVTDLLVQNTDENLPEVPYVTIVNLNIPGAFRNTNQNGVVDLESGLNRRDFLPDTVPSNNGQTVNSEIPGTFRNTNQNRVVDLESVLNHRDFLHDTLSLNWQWSTDDGQIVDPKIPGAFRNTRQFLQQFVNISETEAQYLEKRTEDTTPVYVRVDDLHENLKQLRDVMGQPGANEHPQQQIWRQTVSRLWHWLVDAEREGGFQLEPLVPEGTTLDTPITQEIPSGVLVTLDMFQTWQEELDNRWRRAVQGNDKLKQQFHHLAKVTRYLEDQQHKEERRRRKVQNQKALSADPLMGGLRQNFFLNARPLLIQLQLTLRELPENHPHWSSLANLFLTLYHKVVVPADSSYKPGVSLHVVEGPSNTVSEIWGPLITQNVASRVRRNIQRLQFTDFYYKNRDRFERFLNQYDATLALEKQEQFETQGRPTEDSMILPLALPAPGAMLQFIQWMLKELQRNQNFPELHPDGIQQLAKDFTLYSIALQQVSQKSRFYTGSRSAPWFQARVAVIKSRPHTLLWTFANLPNAEHAAPFLRNLPSTLHEGDSRSLVQGVHTISMLGQMITSALKTTARGRQVAPDPDDAPSHAYFVADVTYALKQLRQHPRYQNFLRNFAPTLTALQMWYLRHTRWDAPWDRFRDPDELSVEFVDTQLVLAPLHQSYGPIQRYFQRHSSVVFDLKALLREISSALRLNTQKNPQSASQVNEFIKTARTFSHFLEQMNRSGKIPELRQDQLVLVPSHERFSELAQALQTQLLNKAAKIPELKTVTEIIAKRMKDVTRHIDKAMDHLKAQQVDILRRSKYEGSMALVPKIVYNNVNLSEVIRQYLQLAHDVPLSPEVLETVNEVQPNGVLDLYQKLTQQWQPPVAHVEGGGPVILGTPDFFQLTSVAESSGLPSLVQLAWRARQIFHEPAPSSNFIKSQEEKVLAKLRQKFAMLPTRKTPGRQEQPSSEGESNFRWRTTPPTLPLLNTNETLNLPEKSNTTAVPVKLAVMGPYNSVLANHTLVELNQEIARAQQILDELQLNPKLSADDRKLAVHIQDVFQNIKNTVSVVEPENYVTVRIIPEPEGLKSLTEQVSHFPEKTGTGVARALRVTHTILRDANHELFQRLLTKWKPLAEALEEQGFAGQAFVDSTPGGSFNYVLTYQQLKNAALALTDDTLNQVTNQEQRNTLLLWRQWARAMVQVQATGQTEEGDEKQHRDTRFNLPSFLQLLQKVVVRVGQREQREWMVRVSEEAYNYKNMLMVMTNLSITWGQAVATKLLSFTNRLWDGSVAILQAVGSMLAKNTMFVYTYGLWAVRKTVFCVWQGLGQLGNGVVLAVKKSIDSLIQLPSKISILIQNFLEVLENVGGWVKSTMTAVWSRVKNKGMDSYTQLVEKLNQLQQSINRIVSMISWTVTTTTAFLVTAWTTLRPYGEAAILITGEFLDVTLITIGNLLASMGQIVMSGLQQLSEAEYQRRFEEAWTAAKSTIQNIGAGLKASMINLNHAMEPVSEALNLMMGHPRFSNRVSKLYNPTTTPKNFDEIIYRDALLLTDPEAKSSPRQGMLKLSDRDRIRNDLQRMGLNVSTIWTGVPQTNLPTKAPKLTATRNDKIVLPIPPQPNGPFCRFSPGTQWFMSAAQEISRVVKNIDPSATWDPPPFKQSAVHQLEDQERVFNQTRLPANAQDRWLRQPQTQRVTDSTGVALVSRAIYRTPFDHLTSGDIWSRNFVHQVLQNQVQNLKTPRAPVNLRKGLQNWSTSLVEGILASRQSGMPDYTPYLELYQRTGGNLRLIVPLLFYFNPYVMGSYRWHRDSSTGATILTRFVHQQRSGQSLLTGRVIIYDTGAGTQSTVMTPQTQTYQGHSFWRALQQGRRNGDTVWVGESSDGVTVRISGLPGHQVPVSAQSLATGVVQHGGDAMSLGRNSMIFAMDMALALIHYASPNFMDQQTYARIIAYVVASAYESGLSLEQTKNILMALNADYLTDERNYALPPEDVQEMVVIGYAQGSDPLNRELFHTTFHLSPWSKLALNWQNVGGGHKQTYSFLKALEQEGVHGSHLLREMVDHVHEQSSDGHVTFDRLLKKLMKTSMDPYDVFFTLAVILGDQAVVSGATASLGTIYDQTFYTAKAVALTTESQNVPSVIHIPIANPMGSNVTLVDHQQTQNRLYRTLGAPVDGDFASSVGLTSYLADQLLAKGNASAVFDLFAASRVSDLSGKTSSLPLTLFDTGVCMLMTLNTTAVVAQHPPQTLKDLDTSSPMFRTWQNVSQDLSAIDSQSPAFPFNIFKSPGIVNGNPFIEAINFARSVILTPAQRLSQAHLRLAEKLRKRAYYAQKSALNSSPFRRRLAPVVADTAKLMKANGMTITSYLWRQVPSLRDRFWRAEEVEALQGELGLILTHSRGSNTAHQEKAMSVQFEKILNEEVQRNIVRSINKMIYNTYEEMEQISQNTLVGRVMQWFGLGSEKAELTEETAILLSSPEKMSNVIQAYDKKKQNEADPFLGKVLQNTMTFGAIALGPVSTMALVTNKLVVPAVMKKLETHPWYQSLQHYLDKRGEDYPVQVKVLRIGGRLALTMVITNFLTFPLSQGSMAVVDHTLFRDTPLGAVTRGMTLQDQVETIRAFSSEDLLDFASRLEYGNLYEAAQSMYGLTPVQIDQFILESSHNSGEAIVNLFVQLGQNGLVEAGDLSSVVASATTGLFTSEGQSSLQRLLEQVAPAIVMMNQNIVMGTRITPDQNQLVSLLCRMSATLEQGMSSLNSMPDRQELVSHWAQAWSQWQ